MALTTGAGRGTVSMAALAGVPVGVEGNGDDLLFKATECLVPVHAAIHQVSPDPPRSGVDRGTLGSGGRYSYTCRRRV